ncbi:MULTISPECIES: helix-turn-helix domain-containing protein [unclassified Synechocystis]|jgi:hypothetical protein|nr:MULTISPECIES: helix-turn-helix domain-containing protein [unclassified Synechocystis]
MANSDFTLATFRIQASQWDSFKQWAKDRGNSASGELQHFIARVVQGDYVDPPALPEGLTTRAELDETVAALEERLMAEIKSLQVRLDRHQLPDGAGQSTASPKEEKLTTTELAELLKRAGIWKSKRTLQEYAQENRYPDDLPWRAHKSGGKWYWSELPAKGGAGLLSP